MLTTEFRGGLGNKLFQYSFGRLVADQFGMKFVSPKIDMFPDLVTELSGFEYDHGTITVEQESGHPVVLSPHDVETRCRGFNIILRGFFESACHYIEHRERIRTWFKVRQFAAVDDVAAVHIRAGDSEDWRRPPEKYYREAVDSLGLERIDIFTDDPKYALKIIPQGSIASCNIESVDFTNLSNYKNIIIGNSTFAWWAAFLSRATTVTQPDPVSGWRSQEYPNSCLRVPEWVGIKYKGEPIPDA